MPSLKLKIEIKQKLGLSPPLIGYLGSIPEYSYSYRFYGLRHPGGIFNSQFNNVSFDLLDLVKYINGLRTLVDGRGWDNKELIRKFIGTLFSFNNYFNSAYDIILGCCKEEKDIPTNFVWKWLEKKGYNAGIDYYKSLSELKVFLSLFNEIKHSSNRFGTVILTRSKDNAQIVGYYLESVNKTGALVPNPEFHPQYNGEHVASSFNLSLRKIYYGIYKIADVLLITILKHFKEVWEKELIFNEERTEDDSILKELFENVNQMPLNFLPNEAELGIVVPRIAKENQNSYLLFEDHRIQKIKGEYHVAANLTPGDGFSRSWGLPYFKRTSSS